jgi:cytoplasmic iron level regulating protein YaaA (DUF328/UPF0246 family)
MKFIISPAKSLDFETALPTSQYSEPLFLDQSKTINTTLAKKKPSDLGTLMHISDKLSQLNWQRNQDFKLPFTPDNARPAIYTFSGDVYQGIDVFSMSGKEVNALQDQLVILSGLYGVLKPLDLIQAYRLEMGTSLEIGSHKNLYSFWKDTLTAHLNTQMEASETLVNLASNEYFSVLNAKSLQMKVVSPVFKDWKNDKLKIISFYAKKARGLMVRYAIQNNIQDLDGILGFNLDGYAYSPEETTDPMAPVFVR